MSKKSSYRRQFGQFFTPQLVVACCYALLAEVLPTQPLTVDPACGDGAFLRYALDRGITPSERLIGCDLDAALVASLHAQELPGIRHADGLAAAALPAGEFDLVVGNPPFGVATSSEGHRLLASEVRFLLRALDLARPGGYIALVLPSGVLANERLRALREDLLGRCTMLAVVALPRDTFRGTGTSAACSILVLRNTPALPDHQIFFALAEQIGELPILAAHYRAGPMAGGHSGQQAAHFWLAQSGLRGGRMDAHYWQPTYRAQLGRLAGRYPLRPLGALIDRRSELIAGDHVRASRGEAKGAGLPYEYYQTREFMAAGYNYAQVEHCDERTYQRLRHSTVQRHDVLVSCAGVGGAGRGRVCLVLHQPGRSCTGDVLILRARRLDPVFLFLFLASQAGRQQLLRLQNGVGTVNISTNELLEIELPLVPPAQQAALAAEYAPIEAAHHAAMSALQRGDQPAFARERARSEALLAELLGRVGLLLLGEQQQND
jgi:hypothetical protein